MADGDGQWPVLVQHDAWGAVTDRVPVDGAYLPPPPPFAAPPLLWGNEDYVRGLFSSSGVQLEFERAIAEELEPFPDGAAAVDFLATNFGPLIKLHAMLAAQDKWEPLRNTLAEIYDRHEPGEYLVVLGRKN